MSDRYQYQKHFGVETEKIGVKHLFFIFSKKTPDTTLQRPPYNAKSIISHSIAYTKILQDDYNVNSKVIFQLYAMVDKSKFNIKDKSIVCSNLGIDPSNFNVVYCGSFDKVHTPDLMIPMIYNLKDLQIKFILIGDGPLLDRFKKKIKELKLSDKVIFTGRLQHEKVVEYIQASDLGIESPWDKRSKRYGGESIKIYEYMACGNLLLIII